MSKAINIAILYQSKPAPEAGGIIKPFKPGGYSDSGADIAFQLSDIVNVITPKKKPDSENALDWVFPDDLQGIQNAYDLGARIFWLNTVLYKEHSIKKMIGKGISIVGQNPDKVDTFDDKFVTNSLLIRNGLPGSRSLVFKVTDSDLFIPFPYPYIIKPIRGRGSQGVEAIHSKLEMDEALKQWKENLQYGDSCLVEEFLPGKELTITIMPPGKYSFEGKVLIKNNYWALPPIKRFNHIREIAPYSGNIAVVSNSSLLSDDERNEESVYNAIVACESAAAIVQALAPVRIDCRQDELGNYKLFDLNMKPNLTGAGRPNREDQDSLTTIAVRGIGWSYKDLLVNMVAQAWKFDQYF